MKVLSFGSLNLDYIYKMPHFIRPGETLACLSREVACGGKGLNQSIALSRGGAEVYHAGCIGEDGAPLRAMLQQAGVNTDYLRELPGPGVVLLHRRYQHRHTVLFAVVKRHDTAGFEIQNRRERRDGEKDMRKFHENPRCTIFIRIKYLIK